jgi:hypothetical protein
VGSSSITIPFSPNLSDVQPLNPAKKFSYLELNITLWMGSGERWGSSTGGQVGLYGVKTHLDSVLTLHPGEWVRVIGQGQLILPEGGTVTFYEALHPLTKEYPPDHMYAEASLYRDETLITSTQSATARHEVCLSKEHGESIPIQVNIP